MKTITFYSYKGGAGRSLALANAAYYLADLGFSVVAMDFDFEAPGLHYKFALTSEHNKLPVSGGVLNILVEALNEDYDFTKLQDFLLHLDVGSSGELSLLPAGLAPDNEYWRLLSRIDWYNLFHSDGAPGVRFLMRLKEEIAHQLNPDFLLIDSRTGITEMGGAATTILCDNIVCLVNTSMENLEGTRAVLQSVGRTRRLNGVGEAGLSIVLSQLPIDPNTEGAFLEHVKSAVLEEAFSIEDTIQCDDFYVLHLHDNLRTAESLLILDANSGANLELRKDYFRLFSSLLPEAILEENLADLIASARERIWTNPDAAVRALQDLTLSFERAEIYLEIVRLYCIRNITSADAIEAAYNYSRLREGDLHEVILDFIDIWLKVPSYEKERLRFTQEFWLNYFLEAFEKNSKYAVYLFTEMRPPLELSAATLQSFEVRGDTDSTIFTTWLAKKWLEIEHYEMAIHYCITLYDKGEKSEEITRIWLNAALQANDPDHLLNVLNRYESSDIPVNRSLIYEAYLQLGSFEKSNAVAGDWFANYSPRSKDGRMRNISLLNSFVQVAARYGQIEGLARVARLRLKDQVVSWLLNEKNLRDRDANLDEFLTELRNAP